MLYLNWRIIKIIILFFIEFVEQQKQQKHENISSKNNLLKQQNIQQFRSKTSNSLIFNNTTKRLKSNNNNRIPEGNILPRIRNLKGPPQSQQRTLINNNQLTKTKFTKTLIFPLQLNNNSKIIPKANTPQRLFLQSLLSKKQKERNKQKIKEQSNPTENLALELKRRQNILFKEKIRNSFLNKNERKEGKTTIGESRQKNNNLTIINKQKQLLPNDKRHENILLLKIKEKDSSFEREKAKKLLRERVFSIPTISPPITFLTTTLNPFILISSTEIEQNSLEKIEEEKEKEEELKEEEELLLLTTTISTSTSSFSSIIKSPPGMMPPNDNIVNELNNANDFMEVANKLGIIEMFSNKRTTTTIF